MTRAMCAQFEVLKKIRKKGKVNGYDVDLAEAQAKDFLSMKNRLDNIESDVASIKTEQARQGGMIEAIFNRLNSPIEEERLRGAYWCAAMVILKSPKTWIAIMILVFLIAMTGQEIKQLLGWVPAVVG